MVILLLGRVLFCTRLIASLGFPFQGSGAGKAEFADACASAAVGAGGAVSAGGAAGAVSAAGGVCATAGAGWGVRAKSAEGARPGSAGALSPAGLAFGCPARCAAKCRLAAEGARLYFAAAYFTTFPGTQDDPGTFPAVGTGPLIANAIGLAGSKVSQYPKLPKAVIARANPTTQGSQAIFFSPEASSYGESSAGITLQAG